MVTILLTGCIDPQNMSKTVLQDVSIRKAQYVDAIKFYLQNTSCKIVFVENSGNDISREFSEDELSRLEMITYLEDQYDASLGKGYGEMKILVKALDESQLLSKSDAICKITGRYKIMNICKSIKFFEDSNCDLQGNVKFDFTYMDSRIFFAKKVFLRQFLLSSAVDVNDSQGVFFEHILSRAAFSAIAMGLRFKPFKYLPRIVGQSGTDGLNYRSSILHWYPRNLIQRIKYKLHNINL